MYLPAHFAETRPAELHDAIRRHPLATLITLSARGVEANLIPLLLQPALGTRGELWGHVARANPLWREHPAEADVLAVFQGPQSYVSPNWYSSKRENHKVVPTWNYLAVQARGRLHVMDDADWTRALVTLLTADHEAAQSLPGQPAWQLSDAPPEYISAMLKAIIGIRLEITELSGKWKLSQNQPVANRDGVMAALSARGDDAARAMAEAIATATTKESE